MKFGRRGNENKSNLSKISLSVANSIALATVPSFEKDSLSFSTQYTN